MTLPATGPWHNVSRNGGLAGVYKLLFNSMWSRLCLGQLYKRFEALFLSGREKCQHTVPLCSGYVRIYMCESCWFNYIFVPLFIIIVRVWSTDHRRRCLTNVSRYEWEAVGLQGTDVGSKVHCVDSGHFSATNVSKDLDNNVCEDLANPAWLWDSLFCQTSSFHGKTRFMALMGDISRCPKISTICCQKSFSGEASFGGTIYLKLMSRKVSLHITLSWGTWLESSKLPKRWNHSHTWWFVDHFPRVQGADHFWYFELLFVGDLFLGDVDVDVDAQGKHVDGFPSNAPMAPLMRL